MRTLLLIPLLASGCATVVTGTTAPVRLNSEPPGARMYVDGEFRGNGPVEVELSRAKDHRITAKQPGYEPTDANLRRSFNGVAVLNLICVLCWGVDAVSGGLWNFDRDAVVVELERKDEPPPPPATPAPPPSSPEATR